MFPDLDTGTRTELFTVKLGFLTLACVDEYIKHILTVFLEALGFLHNFFLDVNNFNLVCCL